MSEGPPDFATRCNSIPPVFRPSSVADRAVQHVRLGHNDGRFYVDADDPLGRLMLTDVEGAYAA